MSKRNGTKQPKSSSAQSSLPRTRRQARALLLQAAPHMVKPGIIRTIMRRSLTKRTKVFRDKLDVLLVLVDQLYDLDQQEDAMNPQLLKAQQNGSIKRKFDETARTLTRAWQELMDEIG